VQLVIARIKTATKMVIKKVMEMAENRAKKIAINMAAEKLSRKSPLLPMITDGPKITKTVIIEGTKKDTSKVTMDIGIRA
jgi:hypothetical protein